MVDYDVVCNNREHYANGPHAHTDDMLFLPLDGFFSIAAGDNAHVPKVIANGSIWFVPGRCTHHVAATPNQRHLCYYVDMPALIGACDGEGPTEMPKPHQWPMSTLLGDLLRLRRHVEDRRPSPAGLSDALIDQLILQEVGRLASTTTSPLGDEPTVLVEQIKRFIHGHLDVDLSCAALAAQFGVGERTLTRWFHNHERQSLGHYVQQARLEEALRLLRSSSLPVADIQTAVGFESAAYFAYAIRKAFGHAPTALRRSLSVAEN